jgi:hypothetical protein
VGGASGPLDPRQIRSTLGQTITDIQDLRNLVNQLGRTGAVDRAALQDVERALQAATSGNQRFSGDPNEISKIAEQILKPLREAELELNRSYQILVEKDKIRAVQEEDFLPGFQKEQKAYFEAVGKSK